MRPRMARPNKLGVPAALLVLALLGLSSSVQAGQFAEAPGQARVVEDQFIAIFEDSVPEHVLKAKGLAKKYELEITSDVWDIVKGFAFRWAVVAWLFVECVRTMCVLIKQAVKGLRACSPWV